MEREKQKINKNEKVKFVRLQNEVDTAIKLIKKGLAELQNIGSSNDFYYPPIIFISNGFEKFLQLYYILTFGCIFHWFIINILG